MIENDTPERAQARRRLGELLDEIGKAGINENEVLEALGVSKKHVASKPRRKTGARARASASTRTA